MQFVRRHTAVVVGAAAAGVTAPLVLIAIFSGRAGRLRGLRIFRRWHGTIVRELDKWR